MGDSKNRKTVTQGYSLDPRMAKGIEEISRDLNIPKSRLVNYIFQQILLGMSNPLIKNNEQKYKELAATNKTLLFPGVGVQRWSIVLDLEFVDRED